MKGIVGNLQLSYPMEMTCPAYPSVVGVASGCFFIIFLAKLGV
jgi:hypothetical protein